MSETASSVQRKVLNVGGNSKTIALPPCFAGFEHLLLDIDPATNPDVLCDGRELQTLEPGQFDAVYCSHNLEHYFKHDVHRVLTGFRHVLKPDGFVYIRVPDLDAVMRTYVEKNLDIEGVLYHSPAGPITVLDVLYGFGREIERSGNDFFAHKTGFTQASLGAALGRAGFLGGRCVRANLELSFLAFRSEPVAWHKALFGI